MNITATGVKGFLQWLKADQPGLYQAVAPVIAKRVPAAFSDYEQSASLGALADDGDDEDDLDDVDMSSIQIEEPELEDVDTSSLDEDLPDVANVANEGSTDTATTSSIGSIVQSALQSIDSPDAANYSSILDQQLQRAGAGMVPASLSSAAAGIGELIPGGSSTTGWLILGGGAALLLLAVALA